MTGKSGSRIFGTLIDIRRNDIETWRSILEVYLSPADKDIYQVFLRGFNTVDFQISHKIGKTDSRVDYALLRVALPGKIYPFSIFLYTNEHNCLSIYCPHSGNIRFGGKPFEVPAGVEALIFASQYVYETYLGITVGIREMLPPSGEDNFLIIPHNNYIEVPSSHLTGFHKMKIAENKTLMFEEFNKHMILYEEALF